MSGSAPLSSYQLPRGRHGIPPELVAENQRWRLLAAVGEVLGAHGYAHTKGSEVCRRAGVSRGTFYAHFDNIDDCLISAFEMAADCIRDVVSGACEVELERGERLRAAIDAALEFLSAEPSLAHLFGTEVAVGVAAIAAARERLIDHLAWLLHRDRQLHRGAAPELPADTERRLVAATFALLSDRVAAGEAAHLPELTPELTTILAAPFVGQLKAA
jgi:AcrR family transcriptional regulator